MITSKQVAYTVNLIRKDVGIPEKGRILTNSYRVLAAIIGANICESSNLYYVTTDVEEATEIYNHKSENDKINPFENVYVATFGQFIKEFRRSFDCIIFDLDKIAYEDLDIINDVIAHGAKNDCITCIMSSCEGFDEEINNKINELVQNVCDVYNNDIPLLERLPLFYTMTADFLPKRRTREEQVIEDKDAVPVSLKIGKPVEELALQAAWHEKLKQTLEQSAPKERVDEILKEFGIWTDEQGGPDKANLEMALEKFGEYPELAKFVKLFKSMVSDE